MVEGWRCGWSQASVEELLKKLRTGASVAAGMGAVASKQRRSVLGADLLVSIRTGDDAKVLQYLHDHPKLVFWRSKGMQGSSDKDGQTALHVAAGTGKAELVRLILEKVQLEAAARSLRGKSPSVVEAAAVNAQTVRGESPLMAACRKGGSHRERHRHHHRYTEVVKALLEAGASPLLKDGLGRTCLHIAALHASASCITAILTSEEYGRSWSQREVQGLRFVDFQATNGFTALHIATWLGHRSAVAALLAAGASLHLTNTGSAMLDRNVTLDPPAGMTPLHMAAHKQNTHMAWILLHGQMALPAVHQRNGADVRSVKDGRGMLPVDIARGMETPDEHLIRLLDPSGPLEEVLAALEAEMFPERDGRSLRPHRRRFPRKGPPKLSALCAMRLRHNLIHELRSIAIATTPSAAAAVAVRRRRKSAGAGVPTSASVPARMPQAQRAFEIRLPSNWPKDLPENWRQVLAAASSGLVGPSGNGTAPPATPQRAGGPCLLKFRDGQVVVGAGVPHAVAADQSPEAVQRRQRMQAALQSMLAAPGGPDSDGSCPATPLALGSRIEAVLRRLGTSDAEASPSGADGEEGHSSPRHPPGCVGPPLLGMDVSPFEALQGPWDDDIIAGPLPDEVGPPTFPAVKYVSVSSLPSRTIPSMQSGTSASTMTSLRDTTSGVDSSVGGSRARRELTPTEILVREVYAYDASLENGTERGNPVRSRTMRGHRLRDETPDDELCPICCEAHPGVAVKVCGHALCGTCARKLCKTKAADPPTCPFCRAIIDGFRIAIPID